MGDQPYVQMDTTTLAWPQFYTAAVYEGIDDVTKTIFLEKIGKKAMVWHGICTCDFKSSTFYTMDTFNGDIYRRECKINQLLPLYRRLEVPFLVWSGLA